MIDIKYYHYPSHEVITKFDEPFELRFKRVGNVTSTVVNGTINVPADKSQWTIDTVEHDMDVYCIEVFKMHGLLINFNRLTDITVLDVSVLILLFE